ncbi:MAG TPA: hypothetical protein VL087_03245 [Nitrospirota bacterium]|nr:hypothetical protein [Nitrospirota bacterium]
MAPVTGTPTTKLPLWTRNIDRTTPWSFPLYRAAPRLTGKMKPSRAQNPTCIPIP